MQCSGNETLNPRHAIVAYAAIFRKGLIADYILHKDLNKQPNVMCSYLSRAVLGGVGLPSVSFVRSQERVGRFGDLGIRGLGFRI